MAKDNTVSLTKINDDQYEATFKLSKKDLTKLGVALKKYAGVLRFTDLNPLTTQLSALIESVK